MLTAEGFVRPLPAGQHTVLAGKPGFSSTIIVDEANTQAFLEARAETGRLARQEAGRPEAAKGRERKALLEELRREQGAAAAPAGEPPS